MIRRLAFLVAGIAFGAGLTLSRMIDPAKVTGFLDIGGSWDPSLAATMAGALAATFLLYRFAGRLGRPLLGGDVPEPPPKAIDRRLVAGAAVFGLGWGLAGICPGPAIAVVVLNPVVLWFLGGFAVGTVLVSLSGRVMR